MARLNVVESTIDQLFPMLRLCHRLKKSVFIFSEPGVGKSEIVNAYAHKFCDGNLIDLRLNTIQAIDVRGAAVPDFEKKQTVYFPPEFMPGQEGDPRLKGVLFADEFDRAPWDNQAAFMPVLLERRSGGNKIPDGWLVVAAGNGTDFSDHTESLDAAIAQRVTIIKLIPSLAPWMAHMKKNKRDHADIMAFLQDNSDFFSMGEKRREDDVMLAPSPRIWDEVCMFFRDRESRLAYLPKEGEKKGPQAPLLGQREEKIVDEEYAYELDAATFQAVVCGKLGEEVSDKLFSYITDMDASVEIKKIFAEEDEEKRIELLPVTPEGLRYLAHHMPRNIKDAATGIRAMEIINNISYIPSAGLLPISDIKVMIAENCFDVFMEKELTGPVCDHPAYDRYVEWRDELAAAVANQTAGNP